MDRPILVVGAGLAGLICARRLYRNGHEVLLVEAEDRPGGRMKTDLVDGFRLDRGFQVYFDAYPHTESELNESALRLQSFEPGALIVWDNDIHEVNRDLPIQMAFSSFLTVNDKLRVLGLNAELKAMSHDEVWSIPDESAETYLRNHGFSEKFLERFARPFFGGIFLSRSLDVSARMFAFVWKMLNEGNTTIPAKGIEEIPKQVAADIPVRCFRFNSRVESLVTEGSRVTGVKLSTGEVIHGSAVVVATDSAIASTLTGINIPSEFSSSTTVYYSAPDRPTDEPMLVVNGNRVGHVSHLAVMSRVASEYGDGHNHLVAVSMNGIPEGTDDHIAGSARYEVKSWFPNLETQKWRPLRVDRVQKAQMVQKPGFQESLPPLKTEKEGLYLAGEYTVYSSIDGAVLSGRLAADAVMAEQTVAV
ncbi:MAG: FAD-dependent oxidoreductase [Fimbriimonadaceae bacterium]|nr:FAD-dependent oxidoreductase [Fimbriimonadaceae bacterium]